MICTPASLAQEGRAALGAQAGEKQLREVIGAGGFTRIRRAAATAFNWCSKPGHESQQPSQPLFLYVPLRPPREFDRGCDSRLSPIGLRRSDA